MRRRVNARRGAANGGEDGSKRLAGVAVVVDGDPGSGREVVVIVVVAAQDGRLAGGRDGNGRGGADGEASAENHGRVHGGFNCGGDAFFLGRGRENLRMRREASCAKCATEPCWKKERKSGFNAVLSTIALGK